MLLVDVYRTSTCVVHPLFKDVMPAAAVAAAGGDAAVTGVAAETGGAAAGAPVAGGVAAGMVNRTQAKLNDEQPYATPALGLTTQSVYMLRTSIIPDAVKGLFDTRFTFTQQTAEKRMMAVLYVERFVPELARARDHWATLCLLSKHTSACKSTMNRRNKRRAITKAKADKRIAEAQRTVNEQLHGVANGPEAQALLAVLQHGHV